MDLVTGAMGNLVPKLLQLLGDEYKLQKGVREQVVSLTKELKSMHVALATVAEVPQEQLHPQVKLWASEVREASYDMEDIIDTFLVRGGGRQPVHADKGKVERLREKMGMLFKLKARHSIAGAIEDIKKQVDEIAKRRDRYKVVDFVANSTAARSIDPRVLSLLTKVPDLVGVNEPRDELIKMLTMGDDDASNKKMKIVSIVGSGGLGKTTLAKVVYEKLTMDMKIHCKAFVSVGQKPELKKVFRDILLSLDKEKYMKKLNFIMSLDEGQLISEIQGFLKEKRYFIVIDDIWEVSNWNVIRIALEDMNLGSKIFITTRCNDVAQLAHCTYKIKPLLPDTSKVLFYERIFVSQDKCPDCFSELSDKILKKCGGVPLAIITIASLLANKSDDITEWQEVCNSICSGLSTSNDMYNNMRKILLLSYYDLPPHLKTCFMYLSMYPEDHEIVSDRLIWRWICEGFIQTQKTSDDLFELGKSYFNDLINRSLVQPVAWGLDFVIGSYVCRVHDMILDMIRFLSKEENFVTTSAEIEQVLSSKSKKLRRLSLKNTTWPKKDLSQVRSRAIFQPSIDSLPSFSCFDVLRVLDLEGCSLEDCQDSILCVGNIIHLRYLRLRATGLKHVPRGIEKLQFLEVLSMDGGIKLPLSIFELKRLMCLEGACIYPRPGNLLRNLASLMVLDELYVDNKSAGAAEELGHLTQLRELRIKINLQMNQSISEAFINSLGNLSRLQSLVINLYCSPRNLHIKWERWTPPSHLNMLHISGDFSLCTMPKWISPTSLPHLWYLYLSEVNTVRPEDIQVIGTLPNLLYLYLIGNIDTFIERPLQKFTVSADAFPRAKTCIFRNVVTVPSMFTRGAMPRAEHITFCIRAMDFFSDGGLSFDDLAMDHLPSLRDVVISVHWGTVVGEDQERKLKDALRHAADVHPNHPLMDVC